MKATGIIVLATACLSFAVSGMPSRGDLKKVLPTVNELMAEDVAAMRSGKLPPESAAKKAEELAGVATDEASKFLLLKGAFGLYVEGGKYDEAIAVLDALKAQVKNVPDKVIADIVRNKMKKLSKENGGAIFAYYAQLDRRMRYASERARLAKIVEDKPTDTEAQRQLAVAAAVLGDWKAALGAFALAGGGYAKAAKAEQGGDVVAAADSWWACAATGEDDLQEVLCTHAAALYGQALRDGKLDGIKMALAKKRIEDVGADVKSEAVEPVTKTERTETNEGFGEQKQVVAEGKRFVPRTQVVDLGGKVKMEFIECPAGSFTMGKSQHRCESPDSLFYKHKVNITRPFWMSKYLFTAGDLKALTGRGMPWLLEKNDKAEVIRQKMVVNLRWDEVVEICAELNARFRKMLPKGYVFRVPSEAEFEYAFRANSTDPNDHYACYFGAKGRQDPKEEGEKAMKDCIMTNYDTFELLKACGIKNLPQLDPNSREGRGMAMGNMFAPVGHKIPNAWGLHDMMYGGVFTLDVLKLPENERQAITMLYKGRKYESEETDPLAFYSGADSGHLAVGKVRDGAAYYKRVRKSSERSLLRLVVGPDLRKEKGFAK